MIEFLFANPWRSAVLVSATSFGASYLTHAAILYAASHVSIVIH